MNPYKVVFSFETPFGRGKLALLQESESKEAAERESLEHLQASTTFGSTDVSIETVEEATPEDLAEFQGSENE
jgi:hypothetical protein